MTRASSLLFAFVVLLVAADVAAQAPDSTAVEGMGNCVLEWGAPPDGGAPALRHTQDDFGAVTDFFSGRTLFTCGTATMLADSAVSYQTLGQVYLVGNVEYQDTLRTLESRYLTYYERVDLVIAEEDVRLVRTADRSTLEGPRVEFLRAVSGIEELTTATGRPHMTLYPEGEDPGPPFEIDADRAVFAGEDEARAYGDVVIDREDLKGEADSVRLRRTDETGEMWGDPWIEAEGVRLEGETIDFRSEEDVLQEVHAIGEGHAIGESFEIRAMIIDIELADEQPERVWAHGPGLSRASSGAHNVYGDSLEFAMFDGAIDTLYSVGEAVALQGAEPLEVGAEDSLVVSSDSAAVRADSTSVLPPPPDSTGLAPSLPADSTDVAAAPPTDSTGVAVAPPADSTAAVPPVPADSVVVVRIDPAATIVSDSTAVLSPDSVQATSPDSVGTVPAGTEETADDPAAGGSVRRPRLSLVGDASWVVGDTIIAVFERPGGSPDSPAVPVDSTALPDLEVDPAKEVATVAERVLVPVDSLVTVEPEVPPADSTSDPAMERLTAIGDARSFFSQVRDSTLTNRRSKNYMIGKRIVILFEGGEPSEVQGDEAIGVFLDPDETGIAAAPSPAPGASGGLPSDSAGVLPDSLPSVSDSVAVAGDSTAAPAALPDSTAAPPDSTMVPPDSTTAPPDTARSTPGGAMRGGLVLAVAEPVGEIPNAGSEPNFPAIRERRTIWWRP